MLRLIVPYLYAPSFALLRAPSETFGRRRASIHCISVTHRQGYARACGRDHIGCMVLVFMFEKYRCMQHASCSPLGRLLSGKLVMSGLQNADAQLAEPILGTEQSRTGHVRFFGQIERLRAEVGL